MKWYAMWFSKIWISSLCNSDIIDHMHIGILSSQKFSIFLWLVASFDIIQEIITKTIVDFWFETHANSRRWSIVWDEIRYDADAENSWIKFENIMLIVMCFGLWSRSKRKWGNHRWHQYQLQANIRLQSQLCSKKKNVVRFCGWSKIKSVLCSFSVQFHQKLGVQSNLNNTFNTKFN